MIGSVMNSTIAKIEGKMKVKKVRCGIWVFPIWEMTLRARIMYSPPPRMG